MQTEISKGVVAKLEGGVASLSVDLGQLVVPALEKFKSQVESGEIDLIKGTDIDKDVLVKALEIAIKNASK